MVVQNQSQLGEGSAIPTDPHHTPTFIQPSTQPQKIQQPRKPKRKDTQVPQPSDPIENVADEAVHKELGDSLVRAATTASSLEAEQDSGNINKTQSKATPNESSSLGTTSGGGPRFQETMWDTIAQTRVLDLENTKTIQHNEIASLKRKVKKLKKKNRSRTHKLKRLYKVGLTARVESSDNEESLGEDASKQGRIDAIDADEEITLVSVQNVDEEMFDVNVLDGEEVFVAEQEVVVKDVSNVVSTAGDATTVSAATTTTATITTVDDITLAQALMEIKSTKPKEKGAKIDADHQLAERLQAQEQEELYIEEKATLFQQLLEKRRKHFAAKRAEEKRNKPPTKAQQRKIIAFKRINTFEDFRAELVEEKEKRTGTELIQENVKKQMVEDDKETTELKQCLEIIPDEEEGTIDAIPLAILWFEKCLIGFDMEIGKYLLHVEDKIYMLVEKKYPLTLSMMLEKKLIIDYESKMAYQLLKFIMKQLKKEESLFLGDKLVCGCKEASLHCIVISRGCVVELSARSAYSFHHATVQALCTKEHIHTQISFYLKRERLKPSIIELHFVRMNTNR
ncbi:hypothetical protein Tco_0737092 [Tanacetum coccineum]